MRVCVAKRTEAGLSKKEIIRCLKRYVAREIFRVMNNLRPPPLINDLRLLGPARGLTQVNGSFCLGMLDNHDFTDRAWFMPRP